MFSHFKLAECPRDTHLSLRGDSPKSLVKEREVRFSVFVIVVGVNMLALG